MEENLKQLLLKDLCARLPYKVKASYYGAEEEMQMYDEVEGVCGDYVEIGQYSLPIESVKPYLFPLSSMTQEQLKDFYDSLEPVLVDAMEETFRLKDEYKELEYRPITVKSVCPEWEAIDFFNKHHLDYNGLIEQSLALDATNLNIY